MEGKVARDSRAVIVAEGAGKVASVTGNFIIVTPDGEMPEGKKKLKHDPEEGVYIYELRKYMRSNAGTLSLIHISKISTWRLPRPKRWAKSASWAVCSDRVD